MKLAVAALAVLLSLFVPAGTPWTLRDSEDRLAILISQEHDAACGSGLTRLAQHDHLDAWRSRDMIEREYFSHTILGTSNKVFAYFDAFGIRNWIVAGENIVWNEDALADSADTAFRQFMASDGHRAIIRNCELTTFGVGACRSHEGRTMYTTTFSRQAIGADLVAATPAAGPPGFLSSPAVAVSASTCPSIVGSLVPVRSLAAHGDLPLQPRADGLMAARQDGRRDRPRIA